MAARFGAAAPTSTALSINGDGKPEDDLADVLHGRGFAALQKSRSTITPCGGVTTAGYREDDFADAGRRACLLDSATVMAAGSAP